MNPADLPIHALRNEFREKISEQPRLILAAPTGSGKSTQISQFLLDDDLIGNGEVIVLQPRRTAARMLARRVAWERESRLGREVGYQIRFENCSDPETRIKYVTEGILQRRFLGDPNLNGVAAVIFDEFHERHLEGDVCLALARRLQNTTRPDLKLIVMSATLEAADLENFLQPCHILSSEGRTYPVEVEYSSSAGAGQKQKAEVWDRAAHYFKRLAATIPEGDFLIFMPGAFEIRRTLQELEKLPIARDFRLLPLHGEMSLDKQEEALGPCRKRKVIVSTNVAESSLTIDGVRVVIDSGQARIAAYDPRRGVNTLLVKNTCQASADQRAGRAGRTAPGYCLRLWSEREHRQRPAHELPEIRRLDLSETILTLKAAGHDRLEPQDFSWLEPPDENSLKRAELLLSDLGALHLKDGCLTENGRMMAKYPLHPRYARIFLAARDYQCLPVMALIVAFAQERSLLMPLKDQRMEDRREEMLGLKGKVESDFLAVLLAWSAARSHQYDLKFCQKWGIHAHAARQAERLAAQFLSIAQKQGDAGGNQNHEVQWDGDSIGRCLLAGFSDHLAKRRDRGTLRCTLVHGHSGELRRQSAVRDHPLFVSAEIVERDVRGNVSLLLGMNTAVKEEWLREIFPGELVEEALHHYDPRLRKVLQIRQRRFRDLVLECMEVGSPDLEKSAKILAREVFEGRLKLKHWDATVETWINRVNLVAASHPEYESPAITDNERFFFLQQICHGAVGYREIKDRQTLPVLQDWLGPEHHPLLEHLAPTHYTLPSGKSLKIRYEPNGKAVLSATIQQLYDAPDKPAVADSRIPLTIELLAPNRRPVQVTNDLGAFWTGAYPEIKKQLKGRYPKHEWR